MRELHGEKVRLKVVDLQRGGLFSRASAASRPRRARTAEPCFCRRSGVGCRSPGALVALWALVQESRIKRSRRCRNSFRRRDRSRALRRLQAVCQADRAGADAAPLRDRAQRREATAARANPRTWAGSSGMRRRALQPERRRSSRILAASGRVTRGSKQRIVPANFDQLRASNIDAPQDGQGAGSKRCARFSRRLRAPQEGRRGRDIRRA